MQIAPADPTATRPRRAHWPLRDYPSVFWLVAALVVALAHRLVPNSTWVLVHLVMLGALTHAILVWSLYFSEALLKAPATNRARTTQSARIIIMIVGATCVLVGVPGGWWPLAVAGATMVGAAVIWHAIAIATMMRRALPGRFRVTMHYYVLAAASLVVGATFGALLANTPGEPLHGRLLAAHTLTNLLGWVGMTVIGTLVTFWPTMLRTPMDPHADRAASTALPVFATALVALDAAALLGPLSSVAIGMVLYLVGLVIWGRVIVIPARAKPPREFSSASVACGLVWGVVGLVWVGVLVISGEDWARLTAGYTPVALIFVAGCATQLLIGALSYLIPTVVGGGRSVVRASLARFNRWTTPRLVAANAAVVLALLQVSTPLNVLAMIAGSGSLVAFLVLMAAGIRAGAAARRALAAGDRVETPATPVWSATQLVATLSALAIAVTIGIGLDPSGAGLAATSQDRHTAVTGEIVHVEVKAVGMTFQPSTITVNPGDQLVIIVVNETEAMVHDLTVNGRGTPRLMTGESAELDLGVITSSTRGWCTIAGHKQAGMVLDILVDDTAPASTPSSPDDSTHQADTTASPGDWIDPSLPPLTDETVHRITIDVTEVPLEVAPGVWQNRWTFNGRQIGPTLHGRVGDTFEVTLVNHGTMGHSIDFHASYLAPDEPMRTIAPGEQLTYTFIAQRAGVWMYHCGTPPVSSHIAAGMHGAVVIEPASGLPKVDREYVLVQSEIYLLDGTGTSAQDAADLDSDKVVAQQADHVVFNGIAFQYKQTPIAVRVGERVRFWVLDAGPNRPSSFHIVGTQWDTVYLEGAYLLRDGGDAFGQTTGGSQALGLQAAQGGFVETVFPEAGHYPMVSHIFSDAESGATGMVEVVD